MSDGGGLFLEPWVVEAHVAASHLLARFAERMDAGDFEGVGALFADAVIVNDVGTRVARGADQVLALYESTTRRFEDGTPRTSHVITNVRVELAGDRAEGALLSPGAHPVPAGVVRVIARSSFTVFQATPGVPLQPILAGRYRDVIDRRTEGSWVFVERCTLPALLGGDLRQHLLFDPATLHPEGPPPDRLVARPYELDG